MYHSPIDILTTDILHQIEKGTDEEIYKAVVSVGINVDKDELLRALRYDRQQYQKGYLDGLAESQPKWISVEDRLPEEGKEVLTLCWHHESWQPHVCYLSINFKGRWITSIAGQWMMNVSHWMPLPQPPKEGE